VSARQALFAFCGTGTLAGKPGTPNARQHGPCYPTPQQIFCSAKSQLGFAAASHILILAEDPRDKLAFFGPAWNDDDPINPSRVSTQLRLTRFSIRP
jgi:hypothetical protein